MESTEKCEAIIQHFNGKFIKTPPGVPGAWNVCFVWEEPDIVVGGARSVCFCSVLWSLDSLSRVAPSVPTEPLLCKFADGGQKKRQNQGKYLQNGRSWARDGDAVREPFLTANMNFLSRILAGDQIKNTLLKSCSLYPPLLRVRWLFLYKPPQCLNDLTGSESCSLFSQGGMTLAYDPTALQNGWVVCTNWLKTVPVLQEKVLVQRASCSQMLPSCGHYRNTNIPFHIFILFYPRLHWSCLK